MNVRDIVEKAKTGDIAVHFKLLFVSTIIDVKIPQLGIAGTVTQTLDHAGGETIEVTNVESANFDEDTARQIIEEIYYQLLEREVKS